MTPHALPRGLRPQLLLILAVLASAAPAAGADDVLEPKRGRSAPARETARGGGADWAFSVVGGVSAAGDLFRVKSASTEWTAPVGGATFTAKRFTVTLDEAFLIGIGLARRITDRGWLRADFAWTEMDATAFALTEAVELVPYDVLTMVRLGLRWEQHLLETPLSPYICAGVDYLDVDAKSDFLAQSTWAPAVGVGLIYVLQGSWRLRGEIVDTIVQFDSEGVTAADWPAQATYTELGPQHLFGLGLCLSVMF
jgi:hypothetical protein